MQNSGGQYLSNLNKLKKKALSLLKKKDEINFIFKLAYHVIRKDV